MDIGVGEKQPIALGNFDGALEGVYFTQPAVRQNLHMQGVNPLVAGCQPIDDCPRAVRGTVVDQDEFEVGIVLPDQRCDRALDIGGLVTGRNNHAERRPLVWWRKLQSVKLRQA